MGWGISHGMEVNLDKTKVMTMGGTRQLEVKGFVPLHSIVTEIMKSEREIHNRIAAAAAVVTKATLILLFSKYYKFRSFRILDPQHISGETHHVTHKSSYFPAPRIPTPIQFLTRLADQPSLALCSYLWYLATLLHWLFVSNATLKSNARTRRRRRPTLQKPYSHSTEVRRIW